MVIFLWTRSTDLTTMPATFLRFSDLVYSIHNRVHILHHVLLDPFFDVFYSEENQTKKAFDKLYVHFMHLVLFSSVENKFGNSFYSEESDGNCS